MLAATGAPRRIVAQLCLIALSACAHAEAQPAADADVAWLTRRSMLRRAGELAGEVSGRGEMWMHPHGAPRPRAAAALAPVWLRAPAHALLPRAGKSPLATLDDAELWRQLAALGIAALDPGPIKRAGALAGRQLTPSTAGGRDRVGYSVEPRLGTDAEHAALAETARAHGAVLVSRIFLGHTGKGADFRLAELAAGEYPGIYHLVRIYRGDWGLLLPVPEDADAVPLGRATLEELRARGYVVGPPAAEAAPAGGWSATGVKTGADGVERRFVYLHGRTNNEPVLDWLHPSFAAARFVAGDVLASMRSLGAQLVSLEGGELIGLEIDAGGGSARAAAAVAAGAVGLTAALVRRLGGFSVQWGALGGADGGADLVYDTVQPAAAVGALATGDAEPLRAALRAMQQQGADSRRQVHALGPDAHGDEETTSSLIAAALGFGELDALTAEQHEEIRQAHLLLAMYLGFQPGVLALSAWDLVGALPLPAQVRAACGREAGRGRADADTEQERAGGDAADGVRDAVEGGEPACGPDAWPAPGAYDLAGVGPDVTASATGLPRGHALYGPLPDQLVEPDSFASRLGRMLSARAALRVAEAEMVAMPMVKSRGLVVLVHRLPEHGGHVVAAVNFSRAAVRETVRIEAAAHRTASDPLAAQAPAALGPDGSLRLELAPLSGRVLHTQ